MQPGCYLACPELLESSFTCDTSLSIRALLLAALGVRTSVRVASAFPVITCIGICITSRLPSLVHFKCAFAMRAPNYSS